MTAGKENIATVKTPQNQDIVEKVINDPELLESVLQTPQVQAIFVQRSHSGPLPPAEDIALYEKSIPNGADRIMRMAEKAQDNGYDVRLKEISLQAKGQYFAFAIVGLFTALAGYLAYLGDTASAALLMGAGLTSIVGAFIYGTLKKK